LVKRLLFLLIALLLVAACQENSGLETAATLEPPVTIETAVSPEPTITEASPAETPLPEPTEQTTPVGTADADVIFVKAVQADDDSWTFHVTVSHPDTGWEDYADGWDVVTPDGQVLKQNESDTFTRLLLHPHETEQPFTRSQSNVIIPEGVTQVTVRAHDLVDGFGGQEVVVDLTAESGPGFEVEIS
jgi:hypothetical protein